jgi:oligo-alginate lyase
MEIPSMRVLVPLVLLVLSVAFLGTLHAAEPPNLLRNPSFEKAADGAVPDWSIGGEVSSWSTERTRTGGNALLVSDASPKLGSNVSSYKIPVSAEKPYTIGAWSWGVSGSGLGFYVRCLDAAGKGLPAPNEHYHRALSSRKRRWTRTAFVIQTPKGCASIQLWLHSYSGSKVEAFVDDLSVREGALVKEKKRPGMKPFAKVEVKTAQGARPSVLVTRQEIADIKAAAEKHEWAGRSLKAFLLGVERRLKTTVPHPDRGGGWYHWYACSIDGAGLTTVSPTEHKCRKCGKIYTGEPYDTVAIMGEHNKLGRNARDYGLAFALTGRPEFAKRAREILVGYADRYAGYEMHDVRGPSTRGSAGKVGPQTLDESCWVIPVAQAYDFVVDTMSEDERTHVDRDLLRAAVATIQRNNAGISNWQSWHNAGIASVAYALRDTELIDAAINGRSGFQFQMENSVTDDGFWYEGAWGYHYYALSAHLQLTEMAMRSGMDLYQNPRYKGLYQVSMQFMAPNRILPAFHDAHLAGGLAGPRFYEVAYRRWHDPMFAWAVNERKRGWDSMLYGALDVPKRDQPPQNSVNFTGLGWAVLRSGTSRDGMYLALDYGPHGGGHGHPDKLGYSFYALGDYLAHDPGCVAYGLPIHGQWYRQTVSHNTVVVDGQSQEQGTGELGFYVASPRMGVVSARAADATDPVQFRRLALMTGEMLLLVDDVSDTAEHQYDWAFHGVGEFASALPLAARAEAPGKDSGYQHIEGVTAAPAPGTWQADWVSPRRSLRLTMLADIATPTEVIAGKAWGPSSLGKVPMVLARRRAKATRYVAALHPYRGTAPEVKLSAKPIGDGLLVSAQTATSRTLALRGKAGDLCQAPGMSTDADFAAVETGDDVRNVILVNGRRLAAGRQIEISLDEPGAVALERLRKGLWFVQNDTDASRQLRLKHADCAPAKAYQLRGNRRAGELPLALVNRAWVLQIPAEAKVEIIVSGASLQQFRATTAQAEKEAAEEALRAKLPAFPVKPLTPPEGIKSASKAVTVQAEAFSGQGGGEVLISDKKIGVEGTCFLKWDAPGHWLEWSCDVPETAIYQLDLRYCTMQKNAERALLIDGAYPGEVGKAIPLPSTGGYANKTDDWRTATLGESGEPAPLYLRQGHHTIRLYNLRDPANLDWLRLAPWQGGK